MVCAMKKFIMYGAGNIGRGFIGQLFSESGYQVGFIDVNPELIDKLNRDREYPVEIVGDESQEIIVKNVYGIDGNDLEKVAEEIATCDIMATAVGVNALKHIARPIALGIERRFNLGRGPLDIIICENLIGADKYLKELIMQHIPHLKEKVEGNVGFVEASIGRMVPIMTEEKRRGNPLRVCVEPYCILPVDKIAFKGKIPEVKNLYPFAPFNLFIQRKLFIHNMSHALCAYLGYLKGYIYIYEAAGDTEIRLVAYKALYEMAAVLSSENGADIFPLMRHADNLLFRFENKALGDTIERVGRDTVRKLGPNDRLIGALKLCEKHGFSSNSLCIGIAAAMLFDADEASRALCSFVRENGVKQALSKYCGYSGQSAGLIERLYNMLKEGRQIGALLKFCNQFSQKEMIV